MPVIELGVWLLVITLSNGMPNAATINTGLEFSSMAACHQAGEAFVYSTGGHNWPIGVHCQKQPLGV